MSCWYVPVYLHAYRAHERPGLFQTSTLLYNDLLEVEDVFILSIRCHNILAQCCDHVKHVDEITTTVANVIVTLKINECHFSTICSFLGAQCQTRPTLNRQENV